MTTGVRVGEMAPDGDTLIAATVTADPMTGHTVTGGKETTDGAATSGLGAGSVTMTMSMTMTTEDPLGEIMADHP